MTEPANGEGSGLAASRISPALLWTHNDSGGEPVLFAIDAGDGRARGRIRVAGVENTDWEDVASFSLEGRSWLLVADTGDQNGRREGVVLHVVEEPNPAALVGAAELSRAPAYSIHFVFEDGARDCEAVAVDPADRTVWLLSKREARPRLYRLPLQAASRQAPATARFMGEVPHLRDRFGPLALPPYRELAAMPTALDFSPDGTHAAVVLYRATLLFPRRPGESWADVFAREPISLPPHGLPQAEAAAFSADGRGLYVSSEGDDRLIRYDLPWTGDSTNP